MKWVDIQVGKTYLAYREKIKLEVLAKHDKTWSLFVYTPGATNAHAISAVTWQSPDFREDTPIWELGDYKGEHSGTIFHVVYIFPNGSALMWYDDGGERHTSIERPEWRKGYTKV